MKYKTLAILLAIISIFSITAYAVGENTYEVTPEITEDEVIRKTPCYEHDLYVTSTKWEYSYIDSSTHSLVIHTYRQCKNCWYNDEVPRGPFTEFHSKVNGICTKCQ